MTNIIFIKPEPDCPHCHGMGEIYDTVDYGSTTAQMPSYCTCVEKQIEEGDEDKEIELVRLPEAECDLCKKSLDDCERTRLHKWLFHPQCYNIAMERLSNFMQILLLPQNEFNEWVEDDNQ